MASAQPYWDQHHDHDTMDKWVWAAVLSSNGCVIYWEIYFSSHQNWHLPFSSVVGCFLDLVWSPWTTAWECISKTLQTWALKVSEHLILNFINYITIWSLSVLEACCRCFSGSAEGYRKCMIVICSADKWILDKLLCWGWHHFKRQIHWKITWVRCHFKGLCLNPHFFPSVFYFTGKTSGSCSPCLSPKTPNPTQLLFSSQCHPPVGDQVVPSLQKLSVYEHIPPCSPRRTTKPLPPLPDIGDLSSDEAEDDEVEFFSSTSESQCLVPKTPSFSMACQEGAVFGETVR